ncbi:MAG: hypothetical protein WBA31_05080 [Candidatus Dormiibacterota bacterium]
MRNFLVSPPFAENLPNRVRFDTASVGLFFAGWSALLLISQSISFEQVATVSSAFHWESLQFSGSALFFFCSAGLELGWVLSLLGGVLMFRVHRAGKGLVIYGLLLGLASQLASLLPYDDPAIDIVGELAGIAVLVLFYLMVVVSRPLSPAQVATADAQVLPV